MSSLLTPVASAISFQVFSKLLFIASSCASVFDLEEERSLSIEPVIELLPPSMFLNLSNAFLIELIRVLLLFVTLLESKPIRAPVMPLVTPPITFLMVPEPVLMLFIIPSTLKGVCFGLRFIKRSGVSFNGCDKLIIRDGFPFYIVINPFENLLKFFGAFS